MGGAPGLDAAQRSWLLQDLREDLDCQVEDAEERGITERGARELVSTHAIVEWLDVGDFPPPAGIELLEEAVARTPRRPGRQERWRRDAYLAAIGELGGDEEAAAKLWRDGVDEPTRVLLDFQGRKLRGRMEELGLTIGDLAERTGIDTVRLVAVLFGQQEMGSIEWTGLSEALDVPLDWMFDGIRFVPRTARKDGASARSNRRRTRRPTPPTRRITPRTVWAATHDEAARRRGDPTVIVCSAGEPRLEAVCDRLIDDRYAPLPAATASAASRLCRYGRAGLLILDLALPHDSALDLLRERTRRDDFPA
jgi:hypothetical protein